jgi:hypothetical protein
MFAVARRRSNRPVVEAPVVKPLLAILVLLSAPITARAEDAAQRAATLAESANQLGRAGEFKAALDLLEQAGPKQSRLPESVTPAKAGVQARKDTGFRLSPE